MNRRFDAQNSKSRRPKGLAVATARRRMRRCLQLAGTVGIGMLTTIAVTRSSNAELDPYYVLRGLSFGTTKPRVLFVLDTSGSMGWRARAGDELCRFNQCEDGTGDQLSRIAAARRSIDQVIASTQAGADFALMTFKQLRPPTSSYEIPSLCSTYDYYTGRYIYHRFIWFDRYNGTYNPTMYWADLFGSAGRWALCGENRPFPYLRWDNLGVGSKISKDDQTGSVPTSPLIASDRTSMYTRTNMTRKVQFFPKYMGVRVNLNSDTDPSRNLLNATYGDYGNSSTDRLSKVWGQDFYYWPYVDGFPGYTVHEVYDGSYYIGNAGVNAWVEWDGATLYSPFYLKDPDDRIPDAYAGPASLDEATQGVRTPVSSMVTGGLDAHGGTPWLTTIGDVTASTKFDNRTYSHSTVASYLKMVREVSDDDICVPQVAVLLTDGDPSPGEGGSVLYQRLSNLRRVLDTKVYVVGFVHDSPTLTAMACAA